MAEVTGEETTDKVLMVRLKAFSLPVNGENVSVGLRIIVNNLPSIVCRERCGLVGSGSDVGINDVSEGFFYPLE